MALKYCTRIFVCILVLRSSKVFAKLLQMPHDFPVCSNGPGLRRIWPVRRQVGWSILPWVHCCVNLLWSASVAVYNQLTLIFPLHGSFHNLHNCTFDRLTYRAKTQLLFSENNCVILVWTFSTRITHVLPGRHNTNLYIQVRVLRNVH